MSFDILNIKSPEFLKDLNVDQLNELCQDIRQFIIENVSKTGGHLSSNLGVIEATVALHYVFNSPKDKIMKFEELLKELENIVKELESGSLSLDESIKKYQKGIELSNECKKMLEEAKTLIINKTE